MRLKNFNQENTESGMGAFRIICVDDEQGVLNALKVILERYGYIVEGYCDHIEALERIKNTQYDLLILDYILDGITGDKVIKSLREFNSDLYILLLTGHSESVPPIETMENNKIQGYCTKSNDPTQLTLMVKSAHRAIEMMREIKSTRDGLNKVLETVPEIYKLQPIDEIIEKILSSVLPIVKTESAFIMVDNLHEKGEVSNKTFYRGTGKFNFDITKSSHFFDTDLMHNLGLARTNKKMVVFETGVFLPLMNSEEECMGVLHFELNSLKEIPLIEIFTTQASSSINNAFLHSLINIKNEELRSTFEIMKKRFEETINTLRLAVDAKDEYTCGHSDRVAHYAVQIGKIMGMTNEQELEILRIGGVFHDIGKIGTSDDILLADRKLTDEEFEVIRKHPITGANILSSFSMFCDVVPIVRCHHERIDGNGYPMGYKGDEIPFMARIVSLADAFDAMTTNRVYRKKMELSTALNILLESAGTQFDAQIANIFVNAVKEGRLKMIE